MAYAIISVGGKQYRVREGERLLVDRLPTAEGKTFSPRVLMAADEGDVDLDGGGVSVTARVVGHVRGAKIRIGKYRPKSGYRRHAGFRAALSQIEIETIGRGERKTKRAPAAVEKAARPARKTEPKEQPEHAQAATAGELPAGYDDLTIPALREQAAGWNTPQLEAALAYEREHSARKGAIAALEAAIAAKQEEG